jgi:hypothetical protein
MCWSFKDYETGITYYFAFSWANPWRGLHDKSYRNVVKAYLGTEKPNLKILSEGCEYKPMKTDLYRYKGQDYFIENSVQINSIRLSFDGRITQDTTPMLKLYIKALPITTKPKNHARAH